MSTLTAETGDHDEVAFDEGFYENRKSSLSSLGSSTVRSGGATTVATCSAASSEKIKLLAGGLQGLDLSKVLGGRAGNSVNIGASAASHSAPKAPAAAFHHVAASRVIVKTKRKPKTVAGLGEPSE